MLQTEEGLAVINQADDRGQSPLALASREGHAEAIKVLLNLGKAYTADIADAVINVNVWDNKCYTPLHRAAYKGHDAVVELLLGTTGILPDLISSDGEYTPLMFAAVEGHGSVVRLFLATRKVDVNCKNSDSNTALYFAKTETISELLKGAGAV
jgi:ankyrin repeat protein